MFDRAALLALFDFTTFTWESLRRQIVPLPEGSFTRPVDGSGWPTLHGAMFHLAGGWDRWLHDRLGVDERLAADPAGFPTLDAMQAYRDQVRGWLRRVIDETPDAALSAPSEAMLAGTPQEFMVAPSDVLAHILLHERGHFGDIATLIHALGGTAPSSDYLTYKFFERRRR